MVTLAAITFVLTALFPPWVRRLDTSRTHTRRDAGYSFVLSPPMLPTRDEQFYSIQLDTSRLLLEWACILATGGAAWFLFSEVKPERVEASAQPGELKN